MIRAIGAVLVGLIVWVLCATALDIVLRLALPGYAAGEPRLDFTLTMMIARLAVPGAIPSIAAGVATAWVARGDRRTIAALAIVLLLAFAPMHYHLWSKFPAWYHLTFLGSLALLPFAGAKLGFIAPQDRSRSTATA
jgi:hypothetical protein